MGSFVIVQESRVLGIEQDPCASRTLAVGSGNYLAGDGAGQMGKLPNPGCSAWVAGTDQHRSADLHGVPVAGSLGGFVCHTERSEGMALLGILLAVHTSLKGTDCPGATQGGTWGHAGYCAGVGRQEGIVVVCSGGGRVQLVHLNELLGRVVELSGGKKWRKNFVT